uniref:Cytochrome P450 n=1 Tax=Mycena chlorophos TaxID=658473 RepID=A0ABQ0L3R4_MYCCL|nr:cytochrome P450 [Mycena chlorophos]
MDLVAAFVAPLRVDTHPSRLFLHIAAYIFSGMAFYILYRLLKRFVRIYRSPLRSIPGPASTSLFFGSVTEVSESDAYRLFERWSTTWGPTFRYSSIFNANKLYTADLSAWNHVLSSELYVKSNILTRFSPAFSTHLSTGLLFVEGTRHRQLVSRQDNSYVLDMPFELNAYLFFKRKIMGSAFSYAQVKQFTNIFFSKSLELRDIWIAELSAEERTEIDVFVWMNRLTLDTIGLAGFDHDFDSLQVAGVPGSHAEELLQAVRDLFTFNFYTVSFMIQLFFPLARLFPTKLSRVSSTAIETIRRVGLQMIAEKRELLRAQGSTKGRASDLMSLLIETTMAKDIPTEDRMTDSEILAQIPSALLAGHELPSSVTVTWTLFSLACSPVVQHKLREELWTIDTERPTMDDLMSLPYLDAVVREGLRVHTPVGFTERIATKTDFIPLLVPVTDVNGCQRKEIRVEKGDKLYLPLRAINRSRDIWGSDAEQFRPERWLEGIPEAAKAIPSAWSNITSFLAGAHACIGYRVALLQVKSTLFTLIRHFEFELAISPEDIIRRNNIVGRPYLGSDPESGAQLPLLVRAHKRDADELN